MKDRESESDPSAGWPTEGVVVAEEACDGAGTVEGNGTGTVEGRGGDPDVVDRVRFIDPPLRYHDIVPIR